MKFALYASNHGYGHATRLAALAESLIEVGIYVYVCTDRPKYLFQGLHEDRWKYRHVQLDTGVKHKENLQTDLEATKTSILELFKQRETLVAREVQFLRDAQIDLVVADIPYFLAEACLYADIPVMAVSNFDWYYIYKELFNDDGDMLPVLNTIWALYRRMNCSFLLDLGSTASVPGFKNPTKGGLIARKKEQYSDVYNRFSIDKSAKILLLMFGGEGTMEVPLDKICEAWLGVVICPYPGYTAPNLITVSPDEDFLSILHYSDAVLCKPGYSTFAEVMSQGKSMIYIPRNQYPEELVLIDGVKDYPGAIRVDCFPSEVGEIRDLFEAVPRGDFGRKTSNDELIGSILNQFLKIKYPQDRILSIFDLGSNNMNHVLFNKTRNLVTHRSWCTTGLGVGFSGGMLSQKSIAKTLQSIRKIMDIHSAVDSQKRLIATGICRKADNAEDLLEQIRERWSVSTKIINAQTEIKLGWWAASGCMQSGFFNLVIDIGGASTELAWINPKGHQAGVSFDFGLLSLLEMENSGECIRSMIESKFAGLPDAEAVRLICIGLTATKLLSHNKGCTNLESLDQSGEVLVYSELQEMEQRILNGSFNNTLEPGQSAHEVEAMRIASLIVQLLLDRYHGSEILVCNDGISIGYAKWMK